MIDNLEYWVAVNGYEGFYEVSNFGNVRSIGGQIIYRGFAGMQTIHGKTLKLSFDGSYYCVMLCKNCVQRKARVHRLVALHHVQNPFNKPVINHLDGDKLNNHANNLEWCTHGENEKHAYRIGLKKPSDKTGGAVPIIAYDYKTGAELSRHSSIVKAAKFYKIFESGIGAVLSGKNKYCNRLTFKRVPNEAS